MLNQGNFIVFLIACLSLVKSDQPFASCPSGKYKGKTLVSRNGLEYEGYQGIRYGIVPDRFEESKLAPNSEEIQNAVDFGPNCAQQIFGVPGSLLGAEDCLYLNIYTPKADHGKRKVVVFIHGGGFMFSSADSYGANYLIDEDIVLVTINYRLGILGFLSTKDEMATGNFGLKDQTLALKWIRQNINSFGGDKDHVTIMGESAGSASVLFQMLSPRGKGLFNKAVALSGSPLNPWGFQESNMERAVQAALKVDCDVSSSKELVSCMKTKPLKQLVSAQTSFAKWYVDPVFTFPPTLETKNSRNPNPFIHKLPEDLMEAGDFNKVPILMTMCKDEGLFLHSVAVLHNEKLQNDLNTEWERVAPITFRYEDDPILKSHKKEVSIKLKKFYFNNEPISESTFENLTNIYTDAWFYRGIRESALRMGKHTKIYLGVLTHETQDFSTTQLLGIEKVYGVSHADDLTYLFNDANPNEPVKLIKELKSPADIAFSKAFVKQIADFIKSGNMEITMGPSTQKTWNPISTEELSSRKLNWLTLNENPSLEINYAGARLQFWDEIVKPDFNFKEEL